MKILKYLKPYWYLALLAPLFMIGEVLIDLELPTIMSDIVNVGVLKHDMNLIINSGILMLVLLICGGVCGISSAAFASAASNNFANDVRKDVYKKVINLSFEQKDKFTTGSLITRVTNDITMVKNFVSMSIRMVVRTVMLFIGGIIYMLMISLKFGIVLLIVLPIEIIILIVFIKKANPLFSIVQKKLDKVNSVVQENVNGVRVVKAYTREKYESNRFNKANIDLSDNTLKVQKIFAFLNPVIMICMNLTVIALIYVSGGEIQRFVTTGVGLEVGDVMAAITYVAQILTSVMMIGMIAQSISRAKASMVRINEVLDCDPIVLSGMINDSDNIGMIEFKNVSFSYPSLIGKPVINKVNLKINKGETLAILGATGCGKSSLVNLIPRFYDATEGEVLVDNINVKDYQLLHLREKIGVVLQKTELYSGSIKENILWGKSDANDEQIKYYASIAQADDFISSFTDKYDSQVGEKGSALSGGQKQRIAITRAIIKNPKVLIFDDATSALDLETEAKLYKELKTKMDDTTIILIAQRVASARNADRIAIIDNGSLIACNTHEVLIKNCKVYQDIYNSQLKRGDE